MFGFQQKVMHASLDVIQTIFCLRWCLFLQKVNNTTDIIVLGEYVENMEIIDENFYRDQKKQLKSSEVAKF